jgi:hypothetical protein
MRRIVLLLTFVVVTALAVGSLRTVHWDGKVPRNVQLTVTDASTSVPIAAASVNFNGRDVGLTDAAGSCEWTAMFSAGGTSGLFGRSGHWLVNGELTIVCADGRSRTVPLIEHVKVSRRSLRDNDPIRISIPIGIPAAR